MKRSGVIKKLATLGMAVCMSVGFAGCKGADSSAQDIQQAVVKENDAAGLSSASEQAKANTDLTGTITMAGSTSMEKFVNALAESFMQKYPAVTVTAEFTGSSAGIESVIAGSVDIGNSSRNLNDEERSSGAVENVVVIDGMAVITDKTNIATALRKDQLIGIYKGQIRSWNEVGGADMPIVVVGREAGSGTRAAFEEQLEIKDMCAYANELDSSGAVMARVASTPGAVGYVSLDVLDDTVMTISIDGVEPTEENIKADRYLLVRPFIMATKGEISEQSKAVREMFAYLKSEEGQELIRDVGLIIPD